MLLKLRPLLVYFDTHILKSSDAFFVYINYFIFLFRELLGYLTAFPLLHVVVNVNHRETFSVTATVNKICVLSLSLPNILSVRGEGLFNFPACSHA